MEKLSHQDTRQRPRAGLSTLIPTVPRVAGAMTAVFILTWLHSRLGLLAGVQPTPYSVVDEVQICAIQSLHEDLSFLDPAVPIAAEEFVERRDRLAKALAASNVDAFVLEPGYTFQYYGNVSQLDWGACCESISYTMKTDNLFLHT